MHFLINYDRYLSGTHCDPNELLRILQFFHLLKRSLCLKIFSMINVWKHCIITKNLLHCENPNFFDSNECTIVNPLFEKKAELSTAMRKKIAGFVSKALLYV